MALLVHVCPEGDELCPHWSLKGSSATRTSWTARFSSAAAWARWASPSQLRTVTRTRKFNPTSVLVTGRDIITLWVSRMVMFNRTSWTAADRCLPRCLHQPHDPDGHGQRMSKSLGNGVDPHDIIHSHGADALRFTLRGCHWNQDARLPVDMVSPLGQDVCPRRNHFPAGYLVAAPTQTCRTAQKLHWSATECGWPRNRARRRRWQEPPVALTPDEISAPNFGTQPGSPRADLIDSLKHQPALTWHPPIHRWMVGRIGSARARIDQAVQEYTSRISPTRSTCCGATSARAQRPSTTAKDDPTQQCICRCLHAILRLLPCLPVRHRAIGRHLGNTSITGFELPLGMDPWPSPKRQMLHRWKFTGPTERRTMLIDEIRRVRRRAAAEARGK